MMTTDAGTMQVTMCGHSTCTSRSVTGQQQITLISYSASDLVWLCVVPARVVQINDALPILSTCAVLHTVCWATS